MLLNAFAEGSVMRKDVAKANKIIESLLASDH